MNAIQKLRKAMRRNRHQFGMLFGVTRETVRVWEAGQAVMPDVVREFMLKIARQRIAIKTANLNREEAKKLMLDEMAARFDEAWAQQEKWKGAGA